MYQADEQPWPDADCGVSGPHSSFSNKQLTKVIIFYQIMGDALRIAVFKIGVRIQVLDVERMPRACA